MAAVTNVSNDLVWLLTRMSHIYANPQNPANFRNPKIPISTKRQSTANAIFLPGAI